MDECEFSLEKLSCFLLAPSRVEMGFSSPFPDVGDSFQAHCRVPAPPPTRVSVTSEIGRVLFAALRFLALNSNPDLKSRRLRLPCSHFPIPYSQFPILLCYGFAGPLLRVMLRVKTQKSPMFTRVVTLLRVQTPGRATPPLKPPFQMTNDKSSMEDSQFRRTDVVAASSALDCNPSESRGFARILVILTAQTSKIIHVYGGSLTG